LSAFNQLKLDLQPSLYLTVLIVGLFAVILLTVWISALPLTACLALSVIAVLNCLYWLLLYARLALPESPVTVLVEIGKTLQINVIQKNGSAFLLDVSNSLWITPGLTALKAIWGKPMVVLTSDNCEADAFRRLRVILKLHSNPWNFG
jgi:hypothetical protein